MSNYHHQTLTKKEAEFKVFLRSHVAKQTLFILAVTCVFMSYTVFKVLASTSSVIMFMLSCISFAAYIYLSCVYMVQTIRYYLTPPTQLFQETTKPTETDKEIAKILDIDIS